MKIERVNIMLESASHGLFYAVFSFTVSCVICVGGGDRKMKTTEGIGHLGDKTSQIPKSINWEGEGGWVGGDAGRGGGVPISNSNLTPALDPDWPSHSTE